MGFPWKKLGKIGLGVGGAFLPGAAGAVVRGVGSELTKPRDTGQGPPSDNQAAAVAIRESMKAIFPDEIRRFDEIAYHWAMAAGEEYQEPEGKSPGQKAYEASPVSVGAKWEDVPGTTKEDWESYAKRRGIE